MLGFIVRLPLIFSLAITFAPAVSAPGAPPAKTGTAQPAEPTWPEAYFEIFKLAPGKQEAFVRWIALGDEVSAAAALPATQLFFHQEGADWEVLLYKPANSVGPTAEQEAQMAAKAKELGVPRGPAYYLGIRELIASHTDTKTTGPVTAAQWLARLDKWRAENGAKVAR